MAEFESMFYGYGKKPGGFFCNVGGVTGMGNRAVTYLLTPGGGRSERCRQ